MEDMMNWAGTFVIGTKNTETGELKTDVIKNTVMNQVLDLIIGQLRGVEAASQLAIKYLAVGTSSTPVAVTDTALGAEIFRTPFVTQTATNVGEITNEFIILDTEAIGNIEEVGIFGGDAATITPDSGTLISRILWHKVKSGSEELSIKRIDRVGRG